MFFPKYKNVVKSYISYTKIDCARFGASTFTTSLVHFGSFSSDQNAGNSDSSDSLCMKHTLIGYANGTVDLWDFQNRDFQKN